MACLRWKNSKLFTFLLEIAMITPNNMYIITALFFSMLLGAYIHATWPASVGMMTFSVTSAGDGISGIRRYVG